MQSDLHHTCISMTRRFPRLLLSALLMLSLSACQTKDQVSESDPSINPAYGIWQDAEESPISFVLEQTWGVKDGTETEMLGRIGAVQVDAEGNIYFMDYQSWQLSSYAADGSHRWSTGNEGDGPGEFKQAFSFVSDHEEYLYVANQSGRKIDRFSFDGQFVSTFSTEEIGFSRLGLVGMLDPRTMVASESVDGSFGTAIRVLRQEGESWAVADSFTVRQMEEVNVPPGVSSGPSVRVLDGNIAVGHVGKYQIDLRDNRGNVTQTITRDIRGPIRPGMMEDGNARMIANFSVLSPPIQLDGGYHLVSGYWPVDDIDPDETVRQMRDDPESARNRENESTLDVYDEEFRLLYSIESEGVGFEDFRRIVGHDERGRIYALMNTDFPQIGRFRVEITLPD